MPDSSQITGNRMKLRLRKKIRLVELRKFQKKAKTLSWNDCRDTGAMAAPIAGAESRNMSARLQPCMSLGYLNSSTAQLRRPQSLGPDVPKHPNPRTSCPNEPPTPIAGPGSRMTMFLHPESVVTLLMQSVRL